MSEQTQLPRDRSPVSDWLCLEFWPIEKLLPSPRNARTHSDAQVAEIAGSIRTFGFTNPILVGEEGDIVAGHGRLSAARKLGLSEVPVILLRGLTELERRQLVLADNRIALNAGWDFEMLQLELKDLSALGSDLTLLGFTERELVAALQPSETGLTDENAIPKVGEAAVTRAGDVWCLGPHRVICGDCTTEEVVRTVLGSSRPALMVTDPPYGVNYDPAWRHRAGVNRSTRKGKVRNDEQADWGAAWALFPGNIAYVWHGALHAGTVAESLERQGFKIRAQIIWAKERLVIGRGDYHWQTTSTFMAFTLPYRRRPRHQMCKSISRNSIACIFGRGLYIGISLSDQRVLALISRHVVNAFTKYLFDCISTNE